MSLPSIPYTSGIRKYQQIQFLGYNHNLSAQDGELGETTLHISIHADNRLLRAFRAEPPELERAGLDRWGISAEPLWEAMREEVADT